MKTPFVRYRSRIIQESLNSVSRSLFLPDTTPHSKFWAPLLSGQIPLCVLSPVSHLTASASVRSVHEAITLAAAGFRSLLVTRPIVDVESLRALSILARDCDVRVTIDHFRHAELLSQTMVAEGLTVSVLLDVDTGHSLTGVRPGPDSVRLATAVTQLPGLRLTGLIVDESTGAKHSSSGDEQKVLEHAVAVAKHSQRMIEDAGIECKEIATGFDDFSSAVADPNVTSVLTNPFQTDGPAKAQSGLDVRRPALSVVGRVISRPSLEWCVIDIGASFIKDALRSQVSHPSRVQLLKTYRDITSLQLSGESLDLRIGDEIEFALNTVPEGFHLQYVVED